MLDADHDHSVSSLLYYASRLVHRAAPRAGLARLGARWGFWWPRDEVELWEFSLPDGMVTALGKRTGIQLCQRAGFPEMRAAVATSPVICAVNSFYLPYRPAYQRVHSHRTVLLERGDSERVWVVDDWPPGWHGWLPWAVLADACTCEVPLVPVREPVFAGGRLCADWWTVGVSALAPADIWTWTFGVLQDICDDHVGITPGTAPAAQGAEHLVHQVLADTRAADRRRQALILRAEVASRCFLLRLLRAAARWTGALELAACADTLSAALRQLELCSALLIKLTRLQSPIYTELLDSHLRSAIGVEQQVRSSLTEIIIEAREYNADNTPQVSSH